MAMSKCRECGNQVSKKAEVCPQCGNPVKKKTSKLLILLIIFVGIPLISVFIVDSDSSDSGSTTKSTSTSTSNRSTDTTNPPKNTNDYLEIGRCHPDFIEDIKVYSANDGKYITTDRGIPTKYIRKGPSESYPNDETGHITDLEQIYTLAEKDDWVKFRVTKEDVGWSAWMPKKYFISLGTLNAEREAKYGKAPYKGFNGSVRIVKNYLRTIAKDPDGLEYDKWSSVYYNEDDGWIVYCVFRGKNSFGGYDKTANWFVIQHGQVVDMKEADAYSFN